MKKILIISYENFPFGGAPANYVRNLCKALSLEGFNIEVILPTGNVYRNLINEKNKKRGYFHSIKYFHIGFVNHPKYLISKILNIIIAFFFTPFVLLYKKIINPYDVIICYNTQLSRTLNILLVKFFIKKIIIILPEFYEKPNNGFLRKLHWFDFYFGLKFLSRYFDAYITLTSYMNTYINTSLKINKPILTIPNIIDPEYFNIPLNKNKSQIIIGYAGTPTRKDGIEDLIKSFSIIHEIYHNIKLLIIGDVINGNSVIPYLIKLSENLNCSESIQFTGLVNQQEIPKLLNSCDILALTRPTGIFAEAGFPTKLGEYFACKKPVLITSVGDINKLLINEIHAIIVEPENINQIVSGFKFLIDNPEKANKIAQNGYEWMIKNLHFKNIAPKVSNFIDKL